MSGSRDLPSRDPTSLHDEELIDFVRDTVRQLNKLADRLEFYADGRIEEKQHHMGGSDDA